MNTENMFNSERLAELIEQSDMKTQQVAEYIGCSISTLYRWINGESAPRFRQLKKLVELFGPTITRLNVNPIDQTMVTLDQEEKRVLAWFRSRESDQRKKLLGCFAAIDQLGPEADVDFAAGLGGGLLMCKPTKKGRRG